VGACEACEFSLVPVTDDAPSLAWIAGVVDVLFLELALGRAEDCGVKDAELRE
jgi:hypothetical protein